MCYLPSRTLVLLSVPVFVTLAISICQELLGFVENTSNSLCKKVHLIAFLLFLTELESFRRLLSSNRRLWKRRPPHGARCLATE